MRLAGLFIFSLSQSVIEFSETHCVKIIISRNLVIFTQKCVLLHHSNSFHLSISSMMESNSPGGGGGKCVAGDDEEKTKKKQEARRARSRSRTRSGLSSRVNFFESGAQDRKRSPSKSYDRTDSDSMDHPSTENDVMKMEDSVFDQSEIDQLEREIILRRQRLTRREDEEERQRRPAVWLRRVVSPVRIESVASSSSSSSAFHGTTQVVNQQFATEVYISSWTERSNNSSARSTNTEVVQTPPTPPPRDVSQPPWRLARRSEQTSSSESPFASPTTPTSAFTKYQEWRTRRLTSVESSEPVLAPWRKQQLQSRQDTDTSHPFGQVVTLRRATRMDESVDKQQQQQSESPSSSRKNSQLPPWYSEYRTASSLSQTASRMVQGFRVGGIKTHYDFHITQIKGINITQPKLKKFFFLFPFCGNSFNRAGVCTKLESKQKWRERHRDQLV